MCSHATLTHTARAMWHASLACVKRIERQNDTSSVLSGGDYLAASDLRPAIGHGTNRTVNHTHTSPTPNGVTPHLNAAREVEYFEEPQPVVREADLR